jgi:hypothetical protein
MASPTTWAAKDLVPGQWPQALELCLFETITRYRPVGTKGREDERPAFFLSPLLLHLSSPFLCSPSDSGGEG